MNAGGIRLDKRLLSLARDRRLALAATISLGLAAGVLSVVQAGFLSRIISQVFLGGIDLAGIRALLAWLLAVLFTRALLAWGSERAANAIALEVKTSLRGRLFAHLLALGPAYAREERTGELANTAIEGVEALDAYYSQYLPQLVLAALVPVTFLLFIFPLDWVSAVVLLVTAPLIPLFMILIGNTAQSLTRRQWRALSRMSAYFLDVLQGLTTLKILGRSQAQRQVIDQVSERFRQTTMNVLRVTFLSALVLEMVSTLSTAVVAVEIGLRLLYNQLAFEQAFFVLLLAPEFYLPLRLLGTRFHAGMAGVAAARRIFNILETQPPPPARDISSPAEPPTPAPTRGPAGPERRRPHPAALRDDVLVAEPPEREREQHQREELALPQAAVGEVGAGVDQRRKQGDIGAELERMAHQVGDEHVVEGIGDRAMGKRDDVEREHCAAEQRQLRQRISYEAQALRQKQVHHQNDRDHDQQEDLGIGGQQIGHGEIHGF